MGNARLYETGWIKIVGRNINNLNYTNGITLMAESEEELKSLLMKVTEDSEKADLSCTEFIPLNPKENQFWIFIGRSDAEAEASIFWPPDEKCQFIGKYHDAVKDWRQVEKLMTEEMVAWHHWLNACEFGWSPGYGERQKSWLDAVHTSQSIGYNWVTEQQQRVLEAVSQELWMKTKYKKYILIIYETKRRLLLGRKVMTNLDSILKSRDITLPTKVRLVKALVFPVLMYGCERQTVKKDEGQRIDAFELWY